MENVRYLLCVEVLRSFLMEIYDMYKTNACRTRVSDPVAWLQLRSLWQRVSGVGVQQRSGDHFAARTSQLLTVM